MFLLGISLLHLLASASPGPDSLLTLRNTLRRGALSGFLTLAGILTGVAVHILLCLSGLALVLSEFPGSLRLIALFGGLYLGFLGVRSLRAPAVTVVRPAEAETAASPRPNTVRGSYREGLLTNLLNPKAILYFLGLFSAALGAEVSTTVKIQAAAVMVVTQFIGYAALIFGANALRRPGASAWFHWIDRFAGIAFLLFALFAFHYALTAD